MTEKTPTFEKAVATTLLASSAVMGGIAISNHLEASEYRATAASVSDEHKDYAESLLDTADSAEAARNKWGTRAIIPMGGAALMLMAMGERSRKRETATESTAKPTDLPKL